ncbi:hypothetical protein DAI22_07g114300 [Oryza sativa Japonica Group]|nr:hypothetical protein DAI22_07g114300 [Oryza sativa Japonica Group]
MASPSFPGACTDLRIPDSPSPVPSPSPSPSFPRPRSPSCALAAFYFPYPRPQSPSHACHNFAPLPCSPSVTNSPLPSLSQQPASSPIAGVLAADGGCDGSKHGCCIRSFFASRRARQLHLHRPQTQPRQSLRAPDLHAVTV